MQGIKRESEDMHTLFVYGSLMKGRSNHVRYMAGASFLGNAYITGFDLYDLGHFPAIKHAEGSGRVLGELYRMGPKAFAAICWLEGEGVLYQRETVTAYLDGCENGLETETFVFIPKIDGQEVTLVPETEQPWKRAAAKEYVWYGCYGSSVNRARFMKYIGRCVDRTEPMEDRPYTFPHSVYFAGASVIWGGKSPAFLDDTKPGHAYGRIYRITREQYEEIRWQEGPKYRKRLDLGTLEGCPVVSFTCEERQKRGIPSGKYLEVILQGMKEVYPDDPERAVAGELVKGIFSEEELVILDCLRKAEHGLPNRVISERTGIAPEREAELIDGLSGIGAVQQDSRSLAFAGTDAEAVYYTCEGARDVIDMVREILDM